MSSAQVFEIQLQNFLNNFYNPGFEPEAGLLEVLGLPPQRGGDAAREAVSAAIEELNITPSLPQATKAQRLYQVLHSRFIQGLSQEAAAEQLTLSTRHLRRLQVEAIHVLATRLLQERERQLRQPSLAEVNSPGQETGLADWSDSLRTEIDALHVNSSDLSSDLGAVFSRVSQLYAFLPQARRVPLEITPPSEKRILPLHPAALQDVLLGLLNLVTAQANQRAISLCSSQDNSETTLILGFDEPEGDHAELKRQLQTIAETVGIRTTHHHTDGRIEVELVFPPAQMKTLLVVDDNDNVLSLYRRFLEGTFFRMHALKSEAALFAFLEANPVDIILVDILMPDIDGWDLLVKLRQHLEGHPIPLGICSVLGSREIALGLGADFYIQKPVDRKTFIQTLTQACLDYSGFKSR